jgi:hypothetical protein
MNVASILGKKIRSVRSEDALELAALHRPADSGTVGRPPYCGLEERFPEFAAEL